MRHDRRLIPLDIDYNILPTVLFKMFRHIIGVLLYCFFIDSRTVAVPAVPTHRGIKCNHDYLLNKSYLFGMNLSEFSILNYTSFFLDFKCFFQLIYIYHELC